MNWTVHLVMALVQAIFASLPIAAKFVLPFVGPAGIVFFRVTGSALAFATIVQLQRAPRVSNRRDLAAMAGLSVIGVVLNQLLFLEGVKRTTTINANVLITAIPVFTLAIALVLRRERATPLKIAGILVAAAGALYLIGPDRISLDPDGTMGAAMITLNTLLYAAYLVLSKDLLRRHPPLTVVTHVFLFGAVLVMPLGISTLRTVDLSQVPPRAIVALAYIVAFPSILAYFLSVWALKRTASSQVAMWVYIQPVLTAFAAPAILGERVTVRAAGAAVVIFTGLALAIWGHQVADPDVATVRPPAEGQ